MKLCMGCMEHYQEEFDICPYCGYEENSLPEESYHLLPGTVLANRYIVGRVLGFGGFGVTYIGYDRDVCKKLAIKEYFPNEFATRMSHQTSVSVYSGDKKEPYELGMNRFIEEARKLAKFSEDSAVVNVYDAFPENGTAYIVMEYLEGETLKQMLERRNKISVEETEQILLPIFYSLKTVHETGMLHRDIAPDNIFITKSGKVKLLDFGAARQISATQSRSLTVIFKPGFAPPEQYQGKGEQGPWTDVYALAATMYRCITGVTPDAALERRNFDTLRSPSQMGILLPREKEAALMHALNLNVSGRTKNTREFLDEWQGLIVKPPKKPKKKLIIGLVAAAWVVILAFGALLLLPDSLDNTSNSGSTAIDEVRVPSFINKTFSEAESLAKTAGISIVQSEVQYDATIEKGKVISQSIDAGQVVGAGTTVKVVVSGGVKQIYMPQVLGESEDTAKKMLEDEGFAVTVVEKYSSYEMGTVFEADIASGTQCEDGSQVTIYVSKGVDLTNIDVPEQKKEYVVSDYMSMSEEELRALLEKEGILLQCEQEESEETQKGFVIRQKTKEGTKLAAGDTVEVVIGMGIPEVNVGDIIGWKLSDVSENLVDAGIIILSPTSEYSNKYEEGTIISAKTVSGEAVTDGALLKKGTEINVVVSKGKKPTEAPKPTKPAPTKPATPTPKPKPTKPATPTPVPCAHEWVGKDSCTESRVCKLCQIQEKEKPDHIYGYQKLECSKCGEPRGEWGVELANGKQKIEDSDTIDARWEEFTVPVPHYKYFRYIFYSDNGTKMITSFAPDGYTEAKNGKIKKGSKTYLYEETPELEGELNPQALEELGGFSGYMYGGEAYPGKSEVSMKNMKVRYYYYRKMELY